MSDTSFDKFVHYGTAAQRAAFTPSPASGTQPVYIWYETDTDNYYFYTTTWKGPFSAASLTGPGVSVNNEGVLFSGTSGTLVKRATGTGVVHRTSGVDSVSNVLESEITLADNTTNDVSTSKHGFAPKLPSGVLGILLGFISYNPAIMADVNTSSTTGADVDATNLSVTFTVPASGNILVILEAFAYISSSANSLWFTLRTTGGANVSDTRGFITSDTNGIRGRLAISVTGLTPGSSITYRFGYGVNGGTGHIRYGDDGTTSPRGPATIQVWAA